MSRRSKSLVAQAREAQRQINEIPLPNLPEREIVRRSLHLANDATNEQKEEALLFIVFTEGFPTEQTAELARALGSEVLDNMWTSIEAERNRFREQIELVYQDRERARNTLQSEIVDGLRDLVPIPKLVLTEDWSVHPEIRYFANSVPAMCSFALALLLDESKGFGAALKNCKLAPCPNFFLSLPSPAGGRPPVYCSRDHQTVSSALSGAKRTERWRKRKADNRGNKS